MPNYSLAHPSTEARRGLLTVSGLLDLLQHESEDLTWADGYADGSQCRRGILAANWNTENLLRRSTRADHNLQAAQARVNKLQRYLYGGHLTEYARCPMPKAPSMIPVLTREALRCACEAQREALQPWDEKARRIGDILERAGYSLEWSDTGHTCGGCHRWIHTVAMDFCYEPDYQFTDGDIYCGDCCRENISQDVEQVLDHADGPVSLHECEFAEHLNLRKTWAAIVALDDDDLTICDIEHSLADLRKYRWPAVYHGERVIFHTPELDQPLAAALGLLALEEV